MKVALLAANGLFARQVEDCFEAHPEAGIRLVWTVLDPRNVLAALDHEPDAFLLEMRWREKALEAGRLLRDAGVPLVFGLFDRLDDPLIPAVRAHGLEILHWDTASGNLVARLRAAG
jgi:hypothetical protein